MSDPNDAVNLPQASAPAQVQNTEPWEVPGKTFEQVAQEVYEGKWGWEPELRDRISEYGLDQYQVREAAIRLQVDNP